MAYNRPPNLASGDIVTEAWVDAVVDSFEAGFPDICTTAGDIVYTTAADAGARLALGTQDSILVAGAAAPVWQVTPSVRLSNTINIDPAPGGWVALTFDMETYDADGLHSLVANTGRITIPANADGIYLIGGNIEFDSSGGAGQAQFGIEIRLNGATVIYRIFGDPNRTGPDLAMDIDGPYSLVATDYVELLVYTEVDVDVQATVAYSPVFWAQWMRMP